MRGTMKLPPPTIKDQMHFIDTGMLTIMYDSVTDPMFMKLYSTFMNSPRNPWVGSALRHELGEVNEPAGVSFF